MEPVATEQTPVYSDFGGDPDLGELVEMYVSEIPDRIATLESAFASGDMESLRRAAHQMKGAGGSYGFNQITPPAAALEGSVKNDEPEEKIEQLLQDLVGLCKRLRAGEPS